MRAIKHLLVAIGIAAAASSHAAPLLSEGFDDMAALPGAGWTLLNASSSPAQDWFQGNAGVFAAHSGAADSYAAANFLSASDGDIFNVLITPALTLSGGEMLSFWARTEFVLDFTFDDNLEVLLLHKDSTGFIIDAQLAALGPSLAGTPLPTDWQEFTALIPQQAGASELYIGFAYNTLNAADANYIGLDSVSVMAVPEPQTAVMLVLGLAALSAVRRRAAGA